MWQEEKSGRTCLHMASEEANVELLRLFLEQPAARSLVNAKVGLWSVWGTCFSRVFSV